MSFIKFWVFLFSVLITVGQVQAESMPEDSPADIHSLIEKGDNLLNTITEENCRQAITAYESALEIDPDNYEANWKTSKAYVLILDLKTAGIIEEKDEYKPLLKELGEKAEHYAEKAYSLNPKGVDALIWYNSSYGYHASSLGILQAILKGAGGRLKKLANELIAIDDTASDALGYRMLTRFHLNAPFPVGSKKKALEYAKQAVDKAPRSLFDHYWLAEAYVVRDNFEGAKEALQFILDNPPTPAEVHFSQAIKEAAQKRLQHLIPTH